jgi:hypothetical protein
MKKVVLLIGILIIGTIVYSQNAKKGFHFDKSRIYYGGNFWINPSNRGFSMLIAPEIGYYLTPHLLFATGISYTYIKNRRDPYYTKHFVTSYKVFSRYYFHSKEIPFLNNLFAHTEYETMFLTSKYFENDILKSTSHFHYDNVYVGGGYIQRLGGRFSMYMILLYNLNYNPDSPMEEFVYRIGFGI